MEPSMHDVKIPPDSHIPENPPVPVRQHPLYPTQGKCWQVECNMPQESVVRYHQERCSVPSALELGEVSPILTAAGCRGHASNAIQFSNIPEEEFTEHFPSRITILKSNGLSCYIRS